MQSRKKRSTGSFNTVTSCISTTLVLILLGTVVTFVTMANNFSRQLREEFTVTVLVNDTTSNATQYKLQAALRQMPYARHVNYISKEKGTKELNEALQGDMGDFIGASPIPAEFEIYLKADYTNEDSLNRYVPALKSLPGVSDVVYPREEIQTLSKTIPTVSLVLLALAVLLTFVSFSLINNTVRMNIYARRFTIHTMKLVGAKWRYIRRPFLAQAFRIGLVAALLAGGLIGGGLYYMQYVVGGGEVYFNQLVTPTVWIATIGTIVVCGLLLTILCAFISVNRFLKMSGADMYLK